MYLQLEESDICLLQTINCNIDILYEDEIRGELRRIIISSVVNKKITIEDLNRLLELLLQFKTYQQQDYREESDEFSVDWPEFKKCSNVKYKRNVVRICQRLNNLLFMQYVVNQKNANTHIDKRNEGVIENRINNFVEIL